MVLFENDLYVLGGIMAENTELSFEQAAARIDEIVNQLERGDAPLEKSLTLFEEGASLIKMCNNLLDKAEKKVVSLQKSIEEEKIEETLFDDE